MDTEIDNFIKQNSKKKVYKKRGSKAGQKGGSKKNTKSKKQKGGNVDESGSGIGNIHFDDKIEPLKFTDNIMRLSDGKVSSPIINYKQTEKYMVSVSGSGTVYITLQPKKMPMTYEEYKNEK